MNLASRLESQLEQQLDERRRRRWSRRAAPYMAAVFTWSFAVGPITGAWAEMAARPPITRENGPGHVRKLSRLEAERIVGAQTSGGAPLAQPVDADAGTSYPWEGNVNGTNTVDGNKLTSVPIVGWTARGGLPVQLTLFHNSKGTYNGELGQKWTQSYDIYLVAPSSGGGGVGPGGVSANAAVGGASDMAVHWGDDQCYTFTANVDGSYSPPAGIHDSLVANTDGLGTIVSYDLTTKEQVKYHFTNPNGTGWYVSTIADRNGNTITVNHNTSNLVTSVVDPNSRTLTFTYTSGKLTSVSDPLSRSWTISYTSGNLTQVTWPSVGGSSYNDQFGYNTNYCITSHTDKRGHSSSATYNTDGSIATETDACSNSTSYSYTSGQTVITDANSHTVKHNYTSGKLSSVEDQAGVSESYSYDSDMNRTGVTDRRGHSSSFTFDSMGNMLTKTDVLSHTWTYTYNSKNEVLTASDPLSNSVANTYDSNGNLTQTAEKNSGGTTVATTTFGYDTGGHGLLVSKTDNNYGSVQLPLSAASRNTTVRLRASWASEAWRGRRCQDGPQALRWH